MQEFEINKMAFKITDIENREVELKSLKGIWGELREYGNKNNVMSNEKYLIVPRVVISPNDKLSYTITSIGKGVFDCMQKVEHITLPNCLKNLEWGFWNCRNLRDIEIQDNEVENPNAQICSIQGVLFNLKQTKLLAFPNMNCQDYSIPEGVIEIAKFAFKDCNNISILHLPSSLKKIGINAFYRCNNLKKIYTKVNPILIHNEGLTGQYGKVNPEWVLEKD